MITAENDLLKPEPLIVQLLQRGYLNHITRLLMTVQEMETFAPVDLDVFQQFGKLWLVTSEGLVGLGNLVPVKGRFPSRIGAWSSTVSQQGAERIKNAA